MFQSLDENMLYQCQYSRWFVFSYFFFLHFRLYAAVNPLRLIKYYQIYS